MTTAAGPLAPALLAQVVETSADAIFSEDVHGRITSWNLAAERLYGIPAAQVLGRRTDELMPPETALELERARRLALAGERVERFDSRHLRPDGVHVPVSVTHSPLRDEDGSVVGLATSVQDVTDRVRLSRELADAHVALEQQHQALRRSNRDLEQFAYVASHDLSEPLRVITGYVQLLETRYAGVLDEKAARYLFHVVDGATRMRTLIDDLLEYSRFLSSDGRKERVDVTALVRKSAVGLDADVGVGDLPAVWADVSSVSAVVSNLLSNAAKFARPGTRARVVVSGSVDGDRVVLAVDDDGIGIEPAYRERVFRMFQRLHVREAYAGTGIGLAIVQQVAETHGGRAWVEDSPLGGCRFALSLPAAPPPTEEGA